MLYRLENVERRLKSDISTFILDEIFLKSVEDNYKQKLEYNDTHLKESSLVLVLKYLEKENQEAWIWHQELKKRIEASKRKYSTAHRIEVAYHQKYRCNKCGILLPPTFQVDHIKELCDGGEDRFENLQALCPNCHAQKTRLHSLKRGLFKEHFEEEYNNFNKFKYKKSKYF